MLTPTFRGDKFFLSNFYPCVVILPGAICSNAEVAYQLHKATNANDKAAILFAKSPGEAKRIARRIKVRPDWDQVKVEVMQRVLHAKFSRNPALKDMLLATGDEELIEGNLWGDTFWGVDLRTGKGQNQLGKLLMALRSQLRGSP